MVVGGYNLGTYLKPDDFLLDASDWNEQINPDRLSEIELKWYQEWRAYDLTRSFRSEEERKLVRYAHYIGWFTDQLNLQTLANLDA